MTPSALLNRFFTVACLILVLSGCRADSPDSTSATEAPLTPTIAEPPTPQAAARNLVMGTGEARVPERFTPEQRLLHAVRQNDRAAIERMLEHGVSVDAKDDLGRNTLFLAVLDANDLDLVRWLRSKGAAVDDADVGGRTPLGFAVEHGRLDISRYLIDQGAEVDHRDIQKRTPLFYAALTNHRDIAALLLDLGADVNARDQFSDTPLIAACAKGNGEAAALLLERGANPAAKDQEGRTASERAAPGTAACTQPPDKSQP